MEPINPYSADFSTTTPPSYGAPGGPLLNRSILAQIRVIAILLIVHGVMLLLMGIMLAGIAFIFPAIISSQQMKTGTQPGQPTPAQFQMIMVVVYGGMSAAAIVPGILQIMAGIANLKLKSRTFGIVSMVAGTLSMVTCYCGPTAIGLLIYGLIIYLNETSIRAFALGQSGKTWAEVEAM
jgi:hypothetical protein